MVQDDLLRETNPSTSSKEATISSAHQVFDQVDDEFTHGHGDKETQIDGISSSQNQHSVDEIYELRTESDVEEIRQPNAHNILDGLPIPTFIIEMAQAAKVAERDSLRGDYELALDVVLDDNSIHLPIQTLRVWPSFMHLKTNFSHFKNFNDWQYSTKMHQYGDKLLVGKLFFERELFHMPNWVMSPLPIILGVQASSTRVFESQIGGRAFLTFKELYSWGIRPLGCEWPWLKRSLGGQVFLLRLHLGYNQIAYMSSYILIYDPGDLVFGATPSSIVFVSTELSARPWFSTLEDKGDFRGGEDTNEDRTWKLLNRLGLWSKYNVNRTNICFVLLSYIFDPGGFAFCVGQISMVMFDDWFVKLLLFLFKPISTYSMIIFASIPVLEDNDVYMGEYATAYSLLYDTIMHDLEIIIYQATNVAAHMVSTIFQGLASNKLEITNLLFGLAHLGFDMVCYKGDFEEVGNDMGLALWWRMSSFICARNHLATNNILMTMTCSSLCFDPGGLQNKFCAVTLYGLLRVATCMESTSVWMFDQGGNDDLLGSTSITSTSYLAYVVGTNNDGVLYLMFFPYHENALFQSGVAGYVRRHYWVHHGFATNNSKKTSKSLPNHVLVGHMKQLLTLGHYLVCTHCHSPLDYSDMLFGYGIENQNATILIFDPGGFKCWPKMRNRLEAYRYNGYNYEDTQIYVFDPRGPLMWLAMDAMVTNPKPGLGMCYVMSCLKYHLSLILEDKDRFERRVLIHTET